MKKTLLIPCLMCCAALASAQKASYSEPGPVTGARALSLAKAVTDTIAPGFWANDPTAQLTLWGALCDEGGIEVPCGFIIGTNGYGDKAKAQQFLLDEPTVVEGVIYWFYAKGGNENAVVHARLYAANGNGTTASGPVSNAPGTVLANKDFTLADVDTTAENGFTAVMFDNPVYVPIEFALGFDVSSLGANDSLGLIGTSTDMTDFPEFSWEKWGNNTWATLQYAWGPNLNVDLCVFALVDNNSVGIGETGSLNNMRMSFLNGNISEGTTVLGYDVVSSGRMDLVVHNSRGQVMHEVAFGQQGVGNYTHVIDTRSWAAGSYYVTLKNNGRPLTKKLFKQ
jgi:hypothetical protein